MSPEGERGDYAEAWVVGLQTIGDRIVMRTLWTIVR